MTGDDARQDRQRHEQDERVARAPTKTNGASAATSSSRPPIGAHARGASSAATITSSHSVSAINRIAMPSK
jgi:hypothetical protein